MILFTLAAIQFVGIVDFMIVMPLGPQLLADLAIDAHQFSWVVSAYTLAAGLAGFLAAPWLDRLPRKATYLVFTLGLLVGTAACGLASTHPLLLAARCVTGGFGGVLGGWRWRSWPTCFRRSGEAMPAGSSTAAALWPCSVASYPSRP